MVATSHIGKKVYLCTSKSNILNDLTMRKTLTITLAALLLAACTTSEEQLKRRAEELCRYIPDHELREESRQYMTADFYGVLDTMFNHLPEHEAMDHEWLYYFVTGNGGTMADCTVVEVQKTDRTHAVATVSVRQRWEDGSFDSVADVEEHRLYMERVEGQWLMSDFDEHKADCRRHIEIALQEQALRDTIADYLVREVGEHYLKGELCVPTLMIVHGEEAGDSVAHVWGDFWVFWYTPSGDTLQCVSGGNHSGMLTLEQKDGTLHVTAFEQTTDGAGWEASARRIFGPHYDVFQNMHSNQEVREAVRREQLAYYLQRHGLGYRYYQDYGWPAVEL